MMLVGSYIFLITSKYPHNADVGSLDRWIENQIRQNPCITTDELAYFSEKGIVTIKRHIAKKCLISAMWVVVIMGTGKFLTKNKSKGFLARRYTQIYTDKIKNLRNLREIKIAA